MTIPQGVLLKPPTSPTTHIPPNARYGLNDSIATLSVPLLVPNERPVVRGRGMVRMPSPTPTSNGVLSPLRNSTPPEDRSFSSDSITVGTARRKGRRRSLSHGARMSTGQHRQIRMLQGRWKTVSGQLADVSDTCVHFSLPNGLTVPPARQLQVKHGQLFLM
eukprot:Sspe_Gene.68468::Locus_40385_Transcript_1_2_Confidence_0.667_Length_576::g.68468::m.68468